MDCNAVKDLLMLFVNTTQCEMICWGVGDCVGVWRRG